MASATGANSLKCLVELPALHHCGAGLGGRAIGDEHGLVDQEISKVWALRRDRAELLVCPLAVSLLAR